ncbi:DUF302 domain-containing protein [candidate division GN15 bacterium]|jgi:uncharacterized protein (DUF302 family)|nr:DUF302 domain-containing protein [candidate division GN15 bacterium]
METDSMTTETRLEMGYKLSSDKAFDDVVTSLEENVAKHQFRVQGVHDVRQTLAEKGFEREPLKIIEVCNASFAHQALSKDIDVAMFMPCRYSVYTKDGRTHVTLARPSMIARMLPGIGLEPLAEEVETTLKKIMEESV